MDITKLKRANPRLAIFEADDPRFAEYGRPLTLRRLPALLEVADRLVPTGLEANRYVASEARLEETEAVAELASIFGFAPIQVGWCAGPNSLLNGLEYHKSPEVIVAVSDLALLLGLAKDLRDWSSYESSRLECLFLRRGEAVELKPGTLHFSACKVTEAGFKNLCVLPAGTNGPLTEEERALARAEGAAGESRTLFMRNKWLIAHPERRALVEKGAHVGIVGENIEVNY